MKTIAQFRSVLNGSTTVHASEHVHLTQQVNHQTHEIFLEPNEAVLVAQAILNQYPSEALRSDTAKSCIWRNAARKAVTPILKQSA
ncbi:hypothetical protein IQ266_11310 [filamentous cyanobacterium LEGE 11480]|uniref:Uncharacterized protein n=1 Tax=Romeriopsis navalis LEGE 11480 TaxID=2777977 RepID=A0A928Z365_9CYAN|nr:hypothetical protein [Romeriopsis navalis]MBE9030319.1 hypothetical protein [Romeriopsis navalis LEGE 11480]